MANVRTAAGFLLVAATAWIALFSPPAQAQEVPETPTLTNAQRAQWIEFRIASGRVTLNGSRGINVTTSSGGTERKERLTVRMGGGDPMVDYEMNASDQDLSIEMSSRNRLRIRQKPKGKSDFPAADLEQPAQGPLVLRLGVKEQERVYQAPSIWHLMITEPTLAKDRVVPLLKVLNREWDLHKTAAQIETALVATVNDRNLPDKKQWAQWVEQLGDPRFAKREAADRQLREAGRVVVTYLQQLDPSKLDAEQQYRVRRIVAAASDSEGNDTPEQTAAWLAGDPSVWLALLSRDSEATRRAAVKQLSALVSGPIAFDPAADPATRKTQLEQLRARLASKVGNQPGQSPER